MMVLANNSHYDQNFKIRRHYCLLISFLVLTYIIISGCTQKVEFAKNVKEYDALNDSLTIKFTVKGHSKLGLNIYDSILNLKFLKFNNTSNFDSTIIKKIPRLNSGQILLHSFIDRSSDSVRIIRQYFFIDKTAEIVEFFEIEKKYIQILNKDKIFDLTNLYAQYQVLKSEYNSRNKNFANLNEMLDSTYFSNQKYYLDENIYTEYNRKILLEVNKILYYELSLEFRNSKQNLENLINFNKPIVGTSFGSILYFFIRNNLTEFDFKKINSTNYSEEYIKYFTLGLYCFLKHDSNVGDLKYNKAREWLYSSNFYKNNKTIVDSQVIGRSKKLFRKYLLKLTLLKDDWSESNIRSIVSKYPSKYYLIDLWATWCEPCIEGTVIMNDFQLPENIKVLNLSVDKMNKKKSWLKKSKELNMEISYLIEMNLERSNFEKYIQISSIPRYIIIDSDLNLIDNNFTSPFDPNFLINLNEISSI